MLLNLVPFNSKCIFCKIRYLTGIFVRPRKKDQLLGLFSEMNLSKLEEWNGKSSTCFL